jgi:hypothetical protein
VGTRFSAPVQAGPEAHPASCTMGAGSFPGVRCGWGVTLTLHPLLVPRSKILSLKAFVAYKRVKPMLNNSTTLALNNPQFLMVHINQTTWQHSTADCILSADCLRISVHLEIYLYGTGTIMSECLSMGRILLHRH